MKKIIKRIFFANLALFFMLTTDVFALSFKDGNKVYDLEKFDINCVDGLSYTGESTSDGTFIFENSEDGDNQVKVLSDGTCQVLTNQELLDYYNGVNYEYYGIDKDENNNYYIYHKTYGNASLMKVFIKTKDTEINPDKVYYEIEVGDGSLGSWPATSGDINNYYELVDLMRPKTVTKIPGATYYIVSDMLVATEVEFNENDILDYYILADDSSQDVTEKVLLLPDSLSALLENNRSFVIKSPLDGKLYVVIKSENQQEVYNIYTTDGELLFGDVNSFAVVNSLYVVSVDGAVKFYNFSKDLVYELEDAGIGTATVNGNTSAMLGFDLTGGNEKFALFRLQLTTNNGDIDNPQTLDNIMIMFTILGLSVIGILGTIFYSKRNKQKI